MPHEPVIDIEGNVFAMDYDSFDDKGGPKFALDVLVKEAVTGDMLEDEPDARGSLIKLRMRLLAALSSVDEALAKIDQHKSG
jgi:hypothetical protein